MAVPENSKDLKEELIAFPVLFARQVQKTPNNIAIVFEEKQYTYQELESLSDQFKHAVLLQQSAIQKNQTGQTNLTTSLNIGICVDKSPEAIAAMLGIMKAGAAFVTLDPEYPADRIAYMIEDAEIHTVVVQPSHQSSLQGALPSQQSLHWINCFEPVPDLKQTSAALNSSITIQPSDLAYIMYTSGSTGKPKGVQIEHVALATYCYADIEIYEVVESDRTLQFSTINFDIAIEEIFPPLLTGSCVVVRPAKRSNSLNELSSIINAYKITAVHIATAYWHEWVDLMIAADERLPESLRLMVVTGEKVSTKHYQHWKKLDKQSSPDKQQVLWCNAYGPTEATVSATVFIPDENFNDDDMPIGKPLKRYDALIVDEDYNYLPVGETGQLLIGGPALTRGYLNKPDLNSDVFVEVNYIENNSGIKQRMYKTGDLARWLPNGDIEFAGRIDHQIKLGSYRIEPGEIEVVINKHAQVLESLISYDALDGKKALIAYVAIGGAIRGAIGDKVEADHSSFLQDLSVFLQKNLPAYMVPSRFVLLEKLPKTTNGKIDRKALPDASQSKVAHSSGFIAPRNKLERKLARMWQQVLSLPEVGIHDDFFALGGSSLLAVGVVSRLVSELGLELPVRDFFANPTIASQTKHIRQMLANDDLNVIDDVDINNTIDTNVDDSLSLRQRLPKIKPEYFRSGDHDLYGIHYQPPEIPLQQSRSHAILICHPIGHEYPRSYRNLQQLSIQLAQAGFDVFRFDYAGTGNSSGEVAELTAERCSLNIETAADYIRQQSGCQQLSVIAVRIGAPFVLNARMGQIENLILWDPVVLGANYINMLEGFHNKALRGLLLFRHIRKKSNIDQLFGHAMSVEKRQSLSNINLLEKDLSTPSLLPVATTSTTAEKQVLISSTGYLQNEEGCENLTTSFQHLFTTDDIYWHDVQYTESAFSSPQAFQIMTSLLKDEGRQP